MGKENTATTEQGVIAPNETYIDAQSVENVDEVNQGQAILKADQASKGIEVPSSEMMTIEPTGVKPVKQAAASNSLVNVSDEYRDLEDGEEKPDWILTRLSSTYSTKELMSVYGVEGFTDFKDMDEYWADPNIKKQFVDKYGFSAKREFSNVYDNLKQEYANYQLKRFSRGVTAYELAKDDLSKLAIDTTFEYMNKEGSVMEGFEWGAATRDVRQSAKQIRMPDGTMKDYSIELFKSLEAEDGFDGLAYSDSTLQSDPRSSEEDSYYEVIYNGRITMPDGTTARVKDDAIVSRWDINTGHALDGWFNNNKLEANSPWDYAKIIARGVDKMWFDVMDTMLMVPKLVLTGSYGIAGWFTEDDPDVLSNSVYKYITSMQVRNAGHKPSMTREAMTDGFFGSAEAFLGTVFDVALQVALGAGLGKAGRGIGTIVSRKATPEAAIAAQQAWAKNTVRGTLTAYAAKDSYNEALDNGFTVNEATIITGATVFALWRATALADYMVGEYEPKVLKETIGRIIKKEQQEFLITAFKKIGTSGAAATEQKALLSMKTMTNAIDKVFAPFKNLSKTMSPTVQRMMYEAKQEGLEEMSEELYQDLVKQGATAYGAIAQKLTGEKQGGYMSIFEDGYFKDAAERYATSGIAGAIGGPMGMVGQRISLSPVTDASSIVDIIASGGKGELLSVLRDMKANGELGPSNLSSDYNEELKIFEPIMAGIEGATTLADVVYNTYLYDIATIDTFINKGMFGRAKEQIEKDAGLSEYVDGNAMRKDFGRLMGQMLELHQRTGISTAIYPEMDAMSEEDLVDHMPQEVKDRIDKGNEELLEIQNRIADRKELAAKKVNQPDVVTPETTLKEPVIDPKEKEDEAALTRLEKEIQLSNSVTSKDLNDLLGIYRKIRAIGNGVAAEHYLMQHNMYEDPTFGDMRLRKDEFKHLGKNAFSDQLMAMRVRALDDKKLFILDKEQALQTEEKLLAITGNTEEDIKEFLGIISSVPSKVLTAQAYAKIAEYFVANSDKISGPLASQYDPDSPNSIFAKNEDGTVNEDDVLAKYLDVLHTTDANIGIEENDLYMDHIRDTGAAKEFFRRLSNNPLDEQVPVYETDEYDATQIVMSVAEGRAYDLIENFASSSVASPITNLPIPIVALQKAAMNGMNKLNKGQFFNTAINQEKSIRSAFKFGKGVNTKGQYELGNTPLIDMAFSAGKMFLSNRLPGEKEIFYQKDSSAVDDIITQIYIKKAISDELNKYMSDLRGKSMLATLRKNVLDILNFTYNPGSEPASRVERHSYKDYSEVTDFFVDHIGDPIKAFDIAVKFHKGEPLNAEEQAFNNTLNHSALLLRTGYLKEADPNEEGSIDRVVFGEINETVLHAFLASKFDNLTTVKGITAALDFMKQTQVEMPGNVIEGIDSLALTTIYTDGITQLMIAKWVMKGIQARIGEAADISNSTPYIKDKENDIADTFDILKDLIEAPGLELVHDYIDTIPEYKAIMDTSTYTEKAKLNIILEKALFDIYNDNISIDGEGADAIKASIDSHIMDSFVKRKAADARALSLSGVREAKATAVLIGAITTDYTTTFYPKFKTYINNNNDDDPIVLAAQEHAAKYAASYVYSRKFKEKVDTLIGTKYKGRYGRNRHLIAVLGTAGSGKTTATTRLGMTIAIDILKDMGFTNTSVLPVSNNQGQVDLLYKSLGNLSDGKNGKLVDELHLLLENANAGDEEAINTLKNTAVILIDEVTYINSKDIDKKDPASKLTQITDLVNKFNSAHASANNPISVVVMGDPKQSGAYDPKASTYESQALNPKDIMALSYMGHSFRNKNSFLVDSLKVFEESSDGAVLASGIKYGTANGKYYGVNLVDPANKSDDTKFQEVLNDAVLIDNIRTNIKAVEQANEGKEDADKADPFSVMVVVTSLAEWGNMSSKMKELATEFPNNFKIIPYGSIGGAEANYVIGEFPAEPFGPQQFAVSSYTSAIKRGLNTLASRAFDYAYIVNRNKDIEIPATSKTKNMGDGQVIIPDNTISALSKQKVREMYKEIYAGIDENAKAEADPNASAGTVEIIIEPGPGEPGEPKGGKGKKSKKRKNKAEPQPNPNPEPGPEENDEFNLNEEGFIIRDIVDHITAQPMTVGVLEEFFNLVHDHYSDVDGVTYDKVIAFYEANKAVLDTFSGASSIIENSGDIKTPQERESVAMAVSYMAFLFSQDLSYYNTIDKKTGASIKDVLHNMEGILVDSVDLYQVLIKNYRAEIVESKETKKLKQELLIAAHFFTLGGKGTKPSISKFHKDMIPVLNQYLEVIAAIDAIEETDEAIDEVFMDDVDFKVFTSWVNSLTLSEVENIVSQLSNPTKLKLDESAARLIKRYPTKQKEVLAELLRIAIDIKSKKLAAKVNTDDSDEPSDVNNDFALLAEYKRILGIDASIVTADKLYKAIKEAQHNYWANPTAMDSNRSIRTALDDIPNVWRRLFADSTGKGRKWADDLDRGAIQESIILLPEIHPSVIKHNSDLMTLPGKDGIPRTILTDRDAVLSLFNFDGKAENLADGLELRATKNSGGYVNVFLVVKQGDNRYIVAHIDNTDKSESDDNTKAAFKISDELLAEFKAIFNNDPTRNHIDIELEGRPGRNIFIRAGEVKSVSHLKGQEGFQTITIKELMNQGLSFSPNIYIDTTKGTDQSGEPYLLYTWNKGITLGTDVHEEQVKKGVFTPAGDNRIIDKSGVVISEISRVPVKFRPSLVSLKKITEQVKGISFAQFPSVFSLALQKHISDSILNSIVLGKDGKVDADKSAKITYSTQPGGVVAGKTDPKFLVTENMTDALYLKALEMRAGYIEYIKSLDNEKRSKVEANIDKALSNMIKENAVYKKDMNIDVMSNLIGAFTLNNLVQRKTNNEQDIIIKVSKDRGEYKFNLDAYLKNTSEKMLGLVDVLFSATASTIQIPAIKGSSNGVVGLADAKMLELFADSLFLSNVNGIAKPGLVINSEGIGTIKAGIDEAINGKHIPQTYNTGEKSRRVSIMAGTYLNTLENMSKDELINEQTVLTNLKNKLKLAGTIPSTELNKVLVALDNIKLKLMNIVPKVDGRLKSIFPDVDLTAKDLGPAVIIASNLYSLRDTKEASGDIAMVEAIDEMLFWLPIYKDTNDVSLILENILPEGTPEEIVNTCKLK